MSSSRCASENLSKGQIPRSGLAATKLSISIDAAKCALKMSHNSHTQLWHMGARALPHQADTGYFQVQIRAEFQCSFQLDLRHPSWLSQPVSPQPSWVIAYVTDSVWKAECSCFMGNRGCSFSLCPTWHLSPTAPANVGSQPL